jgi:hypothetical protein
MIQGGHMSATAAENMDTASDARVGTVDITLEEITPSRQRTQQ